LVVVVDLWVEMLDQVDQLEDPVAVVEVLQQ
jgi:hypothetical protein